MKLSRRKRDNAPNAGRERDVVVYFASDIHASTRCWKKFLAAPKFYGANIIIMGGDITGKFLVPIVAQSDGTWRSRYQGTDRTLSTREEIASLTGIAENSGAYAVELTIDEYAELQTDQTLVDDLFGRLLRQRLEQWVDLADERLAGTGVACFVSGGNDDPFEIDAILGGSASIEAPDGRAITIGQDLEMLSLGYANKTPWDCPRDITEDELTDKIGLLAKDVRSMDRCIFNIHVPPYDTGLDLAPQLDQDMKPVRSTSGELQTVPVGSTAVRDAISHYQPMLGLHGHIHESQGITHLGKTVVANPGSEYQEGLLHGVLVRIDPHTGETTQQLVMG